jgi:hypothetical protein
MKLGRAAFEAPASRIVETRVEICDPFPDDIDG